MSATPIQAGSRLSAFMPFLDEHNVLRVHNRVEYFEALPYSTKFPVILDSAHSFSKLLIRHYHMKAHHQGVETVMSNIRVKYWLTSMRSDVKSCFQRCQFCKIRKSMPRMPVMAPLNPARVPSDLQNKPFHCIVQIQLLCPVALETNGLEKLADSAVSCNCWVCFYVLEMEKVQQVDST